MPSIIIIRIIMISPRSQKTRTLLLLALALSPLLPVWKNSAKPLWDMIIIIIDVLRFCYIASSRLRKTQTPHPPPNQQPPYEESIAPAKKVPAASLSVLSSSYHQSQSSHHQTKSTTTGRRYSSKRFAVVAVVVCRPPLPLRLPPLRLSLWTLPPPTSKRTTITNSPTTRS